MSQDLWAPWTLTKSILRSRVRRGCHAWAKGTRPENTRRNQSRRDGTICSPARECRVGFTQIESLRDDTTGVLSRKLFNPCSRAPCTSACREIILSAHGVAFSGMARGTGLKSRFLLGHDGPTKRRALIQKMRAMPLGILVRSAVLDRSTHTEM
jgi:hypothetical protein